MASGRLVGENPYKREFPAVAHDAWRQVAAQRRWASGVGGIIPPMETKMFASESCSKIGCFLEAALPVIGPAVALVWMLSIAASSCWAM